MRRGAGRPLIHCRVRSCWRRADARPSTAGLPPPACARICSLKYQPGGQGGQGVLRAQGKLLAQPIRPGLRSARLPRTPAALACQRRGALMRNVLCPHSLNSQRVHRCTNT